MILLVVHALHALIMPNHKFNENDDSIIKIYSDVIDFSGVPVESQEQYLKFITLFQEIFFSEILR